MFGVEFLKAFFESVEKSAKTILGALTAQANAGPSSDATASSGPSALASSPASTVTSKSEKESTKLLPLVMQNQSSSTTNDLPLTLVQSNTQDNSTSNTSTKGPEAIVIELRQLRELLREMVVINRAPSTSNTSSSSSPSVVSPPAGSTTAKSTATSTKSVTASSSSSSVESLLTTAIAGPMGMVSGALQDAVSGSMRFVQALNPSGVELFSRTLRDVQATIGVALQPIIDGATVVMDMIGDTLLPVMRELQPVIQKVTETIVGLIGQQLDSAAGTFDLLIDLAKDFAEILNAVSPIFRALSVVIAGVVSVFKAVVDTIRGMVQSIAGEITEGLKVDSVKSAFTELAKYALMAAAHLARFLGINSFIVGMRRALEGQRRTEGSSGLAVQGSASFSSFSDFGRQVALQTAIAGASGNTKEDREENWRNDVLRDLERLETGQQTSIDRLADRISQSISEAVSRVINTLGQRTYNAATGAVASAGNAVSPGLGTGAVIGATIGLRRLFGS